jgi:hypothetical protein
MKKLNILFLLTLIFISYSCSKNESLNPSNSGKKLVKSVQFYVNGYGNQSVEEWKFIYQNDKIVNIVQTGAYYKSFLDINYIDAFNTKIKVYSDSFKNDSFLTREVFITYNTNKEVVYDSTLYYDWQHNIVTRNVRKYQYNGNIIEINTSYNGIALGSTKYTIQNENIILDGSISNIGDIEKKYDNYTNPLYRLKSIFGYFFQSSNGNLGYKPFSKNNLVFEKYPYFPQDPSPTDYIYTNQYDNQGDLTSMSCNISNTYSLKFTYY